MIGIIIAAGLGSRLNPLTLEHPKCMLPLFGRSLVELAIEKFHQVGVRDLAIVTGYQSEKFEPLPGNKFYNAEFRHNNSLHSLMYARQKLRQATERGESVLVSYSDIYFSLRNLSKLVEYPGDVVVCADVDWKQTYVGRDQHPISEAELAFFDSSENIRYVGKGKLGPGLMDSEFIGLFKLSPKGAKIWLEHFEELKSHLDKDGPFQTASLWRKAYLTDMLQELIDRGLEVKACTINGQWAEFDTKQDYDRYNFHASEEAYLASLS